MDNKQGEKSIKKRLHDAVYMVVYRIYRKLERFPKIIALLHRINNRLGLFKNKKEALQLAMARKAAHAAKNASSPRCLPREIKVAMLADEFTYNCFKYECTPVIFEPDNWFEVFEKEQPAIFFCESAWSGVDSEKRPWKGRVYASVNFPKENRTTLLQILDYCKKRRIPTVFWNKEDPTHYTDRAHDFVKTAALFDHVFTTALECVESYKKEYGCKSVHCLPFAAQPRLFNPIETYARTNDVIFAGGWYAQHQQRSQEMEQIFDAILASGHGLKIYDRFYASPDPLHAFPEKYKPYTLPALPFTQIDKAYKGSRFALNINTVTDSPTMFARRVFELMACNTMVLTNEARGIRNIFGDGVLYTGGALRLDGPELEEKKRANLYHVLSRHLYRHRFAQILDTIGFAYTPYDESVSFIFLIDTAEQIPSALESCQTIVYSHRKCVLLLSEKFPLTQIKDVYAQYQPMGAEVRSLHYMQTYNHSWKPDTRYFLFPGPDFSPEFPEKAALHFSYLETDWGVCENPAMAYRIGEDAQWQNTLFCSEQMEAVLKMREEGTPCKKLYID